MNPNLDRVHLPCMAPERALKFPAPLADFSGGPIQPGGATTADNSVLLDAYSQVFVGAVEKVTPSVMNIEVHQSGPSLRCAEPFERLGGVPGFIFTHDGLMLT